MPYAAQLDGKAGYVRDCLDEAMPAAALSKIVAPTTPSPLPMGYRSSIKLCLHEDSLGRKAIGLYKLGTHIVVNLKNCPAQTPVVNRVAQKLFALPGKIPARFYNHKGRSFQPGKIKFVTIRSAPAHGDRPASVALIISHTGVPRTDLVAWLKAVGLGTLCAYESGLGPKDGDLVVGSHCEHLHGPKHFAFALAGRTFQLAPTAFFQANYSLSDGLIKAATAFKNSGDLLLDLYGGFGAYSFQVATRFKSVYVVDGNAAAVDAATRAAQDFALPQVKAFTSYCETFLEKDLPASEAARVTHVIVNPPRGGLSQKVVSRLAKAHLPRLSELHYVSCNPETLARDVKLLAQRGFRLESARPFDMFPQTDHVEVVARLVLE